MRYKSPSLRKGCANSMDHGKWLGTDDIESVVEYGQQKAEMRQCEKEKRAMLREAKRANRLHDSPSRGFFHRFIARLRGA